MGLQQETKLKNIEFTRLYSVTVLITFQIAITVLFK